MRKPFDVIAATAVALCACAAPQARKPLPTDFPTKGLTLALVVTDRTKAAVGESGQKSQRSMARFDQTELFDAINGVLDAGFKSVATVNRIEDAGEADLAAILDIDTKYEMLPWSAVEIRGAIRFSTLDGRALQSVPLDMRHLSYLRDVSYVVQETSDDLQDILSKALTTSSELSQFARERPSNRPAVSARSQVPPPSKATASSGALIRSDVDTPSYKLSENANDYALVVGIEKYSGLPDAKYAERDAKAVREHLAALGYPARNIVLLTGEAAGRAAIEKYVESWLPRNVREDSRVFIYFAGHGAPDLDSQQAYLLPADGDPEFLEHTGYPLKKLYDELGSLKAKAVVVAVDACFSGAGGRSVLAKGTRPLITKVNGAASVTGPLVALEAAGPDQITGADDAQGHGIFTYYMLKALNEKEGKVTARGIYASLSPRVADAARRQNRAQTPRILTPPGQEKQ